MFESSGFHFCFVLKLLVIFIEMQFQIVGKKSVIFVFEDRNFTYNKHVFDQKKKTCV